MMIDNVIPYYCNIGRQVFDLPNPLYRETNTSNKTKMNKPEIGPNHGALSDPLIMLIIVEYITVV